MKTLNDYVTVYREQLEKRDIQKAYAGLINYMMRLKRFLAKQWPGRFLFGNLSPGYMDFTYFSFYDDDLRKRKLRFGIVLNHEKMRFELWMMGQNAETQKAYWELLRNAPWNSDQKRMPQYSVQEVVLVESPDFNNPDELMQNIEKEAQNTVNSVLRYLKCIS